MAINMTIPSNLLVKTFTRGIFAYEFFKNFKIWMDAEILSSTPDAIFQMNWQSLEPYEGEFSDSAVLEPITGLSSRRDYANGGNTPAILTMASRNDSGYIQRFKYGPLDVGEDAGVVSIIGNERLYEHFAREVALTYKADVQKSLLGAARAAITNMAGSVHTYSLYNSSYNVANTLTTPGLVAMRAKLGDKAAESIGQGKGCYVTTVEAETDLVNSQLTSNYFPIAGEVIRTASPMSYGAKLVIYNDSPTLQAGGTTAQGQTEHFVIGLGKNFSKVRLTEPKFFDVNQRVEYESVANLMRADADLEQTITGFAFDKSSGGANPTYSTLTTATNWDNTYNDHREVHGVLGAFNASIAD